MRKSGARLRGVLPALLLLSACATTTPPPAPKIQTKAPPADALIGASWGAVRALLGDPGLIRRDQGVEVWQYPGPTCVLLLYLYRPESGGDPKTAFIDARDLHAGAAPVQECLAAAIKRHSGRVG